VAGSLVACVRGSNQPSTITLTRRCDAGCETGAPAVKRGTDTSHRSGEPGVERRWVDPVEGALGCERCSCNRLQREQLWHGGSRFRALSGAMKRPSVSVETSAKNQRATEGVRICVGWKLLAAARRWSQSDVELSLVVTSRMQMKLSQLKTALFWFGLGGAKPFVPIESRRSSVMPWRAARQSWRCASAE